MSESLTAASWETAFAVVRQLGPGTTVRVSKADESSLPPLRVRQSNVPYSVHKGALSVYREDSPGEHLQIREYPDEWTVELDRHNPHYRPARHVALDTRRYARDAVSTPLSTALAVAVFSPIRSVQLVEQLSGAAIAAPLSALDSGISLLRNAV